MEYGDQWHTVACKTTVGSDPSPEVINYRSGAEIAEANAVTYGDFGAAFKVTEEAEGEAFFRVKEDDNSTYLTAEFGEYTGNTKQQCLAVLSFPKTGIDEAFYGAYDTVIDARIYASATATEFYQVEKTEGQAELQPPIYDSAELVQEIEAINNIYAVEVMDKTIEFDLGVIDTTMDGEKGIQSI